MRTKHIMLLEFIVSFSASVLHAQPVAVVRGLCLNAPSKADVERFVKLIDTTLAADSVNTIVLRIDYRYEYKSHPELQASDPL
ncbi:MAG: glycoside hydrolase, partial [Bacteroidota bacterium]|nr:glycoside hydrolase [Bacteroidota bacterium]